MGCDAGIKPRKKIQLQSTEISNIQQTEETTMSSTMVRQIMPTFTVNVDKKQDDSPHLVVYLQIDE